MKLISSQSRIHHARLSNLTLILVLFLLLEGCGTPDSGISMAGATVAVGARNQADLPTPTDIPFELDATQEAFKLAEIAREFSEQATAAAQFANSSPVPFPGIPTTEPYLEAVKTGLTIDCKENYPHELSSTNCWLDALNGQYLSVQVGASKRDLSQGLLIVQTSTLDGTSSTPSAFYNPPMRTGAITITQVVGEHVALIAKNGAALAFNLATRTWEDPSTLPTATPTAPPTSTPTHTPDLPAAGATDIAFGRWQ